MSETPLISVIIATSNAAATLSRCITSVNLQTYDSFELIIIDNASQDGTVELLKEHGECINYWQSEPDHGIYHAWNKGLAHVRGQWVCFLGADDYLASSTVFADMLPFLDQATKSGIRVVYGQVAKVDLQGRVLKYFGRPWQDIAWQMKHGMPLPHPGLLHHKTLFVDYGQFDESYEVAGDYEFLLRELKDKNALFASGVQTVFHLQGGVSSTHALKALREVYRARRKNNIRSFPWLWLLVYFRAMVRHLFAWR